MKTHSFNGRRFEIMVGPKDGICDKPGSNDLTLAIFADLKTKNGLETAVHEALHAENPNWTEDFVSRLGKEIGGFLWRLGYRNGTIR
jgi:hypothetical protein